MFIVTGITGRVGGSLANQLLSEGKKVRAVVRNQNKGEMWAQKGCEVAVADINNTQALTDAFSGAEGVFVMIPPNFDPAPGFPEVRSMIEAVETALTAARPERIVYLSTIGAQTAHLNLSDSNGIRGREHLTK